MQCVFKAFVQCHTEVLCKLYVISVLSIYFDNKCYVFARQMEPLHSLFKSYVVLSRLPSQK